LRLPVSRFQRATNYTTWHFQHLPPSHHTSTPFLYQTDPVGTFLCVQFLVIVYYGLLAISNLIEK